MKKLLVLITTLSAIVACNTKTEECLGDHYVVRNWMDCPKGGGPNSCTMMYESKCAEGCTVRLNGKEADCICPKEMCKK